MYNEDSYRHHLIWIEVKRVFFMIIFSIVGAAVGIFISSYVVNILMFDEVYRIIIIAASTLVFFFISLLVTANTAKEIQDGEWKIATLRKLTLISKKLDTLDNLDKLSSLDKLDKLDKLSNFEVLNNKLETISKQLENLNSAELISDEETNNIESKRV